MYLAGFIYSLNTYSLCYGYSPFVHPTPSSPCSHRSSLLPSLLCSVPRKLTPARSGPPACWFPFGFGWWEELAVSLRAREAGQGSVSSLFPSHVHLFSDHGHVLPRLQLVLGGPLLHSSHCNWVPVTLFSPLVPSAPAWQWLHALVGRWVPRDPLFIPVILPSLLERVPSLNCLYLNHLGYRLLSLLWDYQNHLLIKQSWVYYFLWWGKPSP